MKPSGTKEEIKRKSVKRIQTIEPTALEGDSNNDHSIEDGPTITRKPRLGSFQQKLELQGFIIYLKVLSNVTTPWNCSVQTKGSQDNQLSKYQVSKYKYQSSHICIVFHNLIIKIVIQGKRQPNRQLTCMLLWKKLQEY